MTVYEKNLKTLAEYYPDMDRLIMEGEKKIVPKFEILSEIADDGEHILIIKKEGHTFYLNGKRNTEEPARIWMKTLGILQPNAPILLMGVGNHTYLRELVEQSSNRLAIIVYEPSLQIFIKFLEAVDLKRWMKKHLIIFWVEGLRGMDTKHMKNIISSVLTYEMFTYSRVFVLPNYDRIFPEKTLEFVKLCRDIASDESTQYLTQKRFVGVVVKNVLANGRFLPDGYKTTQLTSIIPQNIPGIVVAAGPSLNKNIQELKKAKGKAFIIAVDTAIKPLLNAGIIPDMFAIVDGMKPLNLIQVEGAKDIPLVLTLNAASEVAEYHRGMKFFYNEGYQFAECIFNKSGQPFGDVSCGGSVATSAFSLLYKIGLNPVILVGQDLAFTNNKSHADGTFHEVMQEEDTRYFLMVEGNCEKKVPTRPDFKLYLDWYGTYIKGCKEHDKDFRVINATEGGAKIEGTEIMTLRDAIKKECKREVDIQGCLKAIPSMLNEKNREWAKQYLLDMSSRFYVLSQKAESIKETYEKLNNICSKKKINQKTYLGILKTLKKQIQDIERMDTYQLAAITLNEANFILRNEQFLSEDTIQAEGKEIARKGILYMETIGKCAQMFQEYTESLYGN